MPTLSDKDKMNEDWPSPADQIKLHESVAVLRSMIRELRLSAAESAGRTRLLNRRIKVVDRGWCRGTSAKSASGTEVGVCPPRFDGLGWLSEPPTVGVPFAYRWTHGRTAALQAIMEMGETEES